MAERNARIALRHACQAWHNRVEAFPVMRRLLAENVRLADYRAALQLQARFYSVIEPMLLQSRDAPCRSAPYLPRLPALAADLAALEAPVPAGHDEDFRLAAPAWGCRYVVEGSALGNTVMHRHLQARLGSAIDGATHFLTLSGDIVATQWHKFLGEMETALADRTELQRAIEEAQATFALWHRLALHQARPAIP